MFVAIEFDVTGQVVAKSIQGTVGLAGQFVHDLLEDIGQARVEEIEIQELERLASEFPEILRQRSYP